MEQAYDDCTEDDTGDTLTLGDGGHAIVVDTGSESGDIGPAACVMIELGTSQAIAAAIDSTTAMMCVQQADDGGIHYQWSYHPDNGLNMVITD